MQIFIAKARPGCIFIAKFKQASFNRATFVSPSTCVQEQESKARKLLSLAMAKCHRQDSYIDTDTDTSTDIDMDKGTVTDVGILIDRDTEIDSHSHSQSH